MPKARHWFITGFKRLVSFCATKKFFYLLLVIFVLQAGWIASVGLYPMAFDEETHLEVIKHYANHPNPFYTVQPEYLDPYGPVVRDASYLYRYIMIIPWRIITAITSNPTAQIITMRFVSIAIFVLAIVLIRKLLLKATSNKIIVNLALLLFIITPITSQLAAQINYDGFMLLLMVGSLLLAIEFASKLNHNKIDLWLLTWLIVVAVAASLAKFTYITIMIPIIIYVLIFFAKFYKRQPQKFWTTVGSSFKKLSKWQAVLMIGIVLVSVGLFMERYAVNYARFRNATPDCVKVIGEERCNKFSIYQRTILYENTKPAVINKNPALFTYRWLKHMNYNLMMALSGPSNGYSVGQPLPFPYIASIIFGATGIVLCLIFWRFVFNNATMKLLLACLLLYAVTLWILNYKGYLDTGRRVAVQGRYLVPFLPFIYVWFLSAYNYLLTGWPKSKGFLMSVLVLAFMAGGGASTYILHSDNAWYWQNDTAVKANHYARNVIRKTVPGWGADYKPYWKSSFQF